MSEISEASETELPAPAALAPKGPGRLERLLAWAQRRITTTGGYALILFLLFSAAWVPVVFTLLICGKSMIWQIDGLSQQYVWYVYIGQYIREFFSNLFINHTLEIPLWTMDSGYGADIVQSVAGMFLNPLNWTSALLPEKYAEFGLEFISLFTLYLAGLSFTAWVVPRGVSRSHAMIGALAYMFSGFTVVIFSQPYFLVTLAIFPLVLLCADRVFARQSPLPFILVLTWCFAESYYDAYMICIMLVLYCLVNFFAYVDVAQPRAGRASRLARWTLSFVGYVVLALLLSCCLMLPQAVGLTGADRLELERSDGLLYSLEWYANFFCGIISYDSMGSDAYVGFNALAPVALVLLFMRRREHKGLFVSFCVLTIMLVLPVFGSFMNGLQYASNRWSWAFALCVAYVVARMLPEVLATTARERKVCAACIIGYGIVVLALPLPGRTMAFMASFAVVIGVMALVLSASLWRQRNLTATLAVCACASGAVMLTFCLSPYFTSLATSLMGVGKSWQFHASNSVEKFIEQAEESESGYDGAYRYDRTTPVSNTVHNSGLITGRMTPDFYNSIYNQGIDDFNTSLGLVDTEGTNFRYGSLNSRSMLEALLGVKYFYLDQEYASMLPANFSDATVVAAGDGRDDTYELYETDQVAALAFTTTTYITTEEYYALALPDRQKALLQGIVLASDEEAAGLTDVSSQVAEAANAEEVAYEVVDARGCTIEGNTITSRRPGSKLVLAFDSAANAETYLYITGFTYQDISYRERYTDEEWQDLGFIGRLRKILAEPFRSECTNGKILVQSDRSQSTLYQMNADDHMYGGKHEWYVNLCTRQDGKAYVTLDFSEAGTFTFEKMSIVSQPLEGAGELIDNLAASSAQDIVIGTNEITCSVSADQDCQLFLSVAYSAGWSATVDGQAATIHKADLGFMSVEVPAGTHEVCLVYRTPYLTEGAVLTLVGIVGTIALCAGRRCRRTRRLANPVPELPQSPSYASLEA